MSSTPSKYERFLNNVIPCQAIYSKEYEHGTLYGLHLKGPKSDAALDKCITFLDNMLSDCSPDKRTRFTSICNTPSLSGKVKTFANGTHGEDMHFKALFASGFAGRRGLEQMRGVKKWTPADPLDEGGIDSNEVEEVDSADDADVIDSGGGTGSSFCPKEISRESGVHSIGLDKQVNINIIIHLQQDCFYPDMSLFPA